MDVLFVTQPFSYYKFPILYQLWQFKLVINNYLNSNHQINLPVPYISPSHSVFLRYFLRILNLPQKNLQFVVTFFSLTRYTYGMQLNDYNSCVHQWADALFRFALKNIGNSEDARDIVQSSFEVLWQKRNEVDSTKAKAFLFQVAYNQCISAFRKKKETGLHSLSENIMLPHNQHPDLKRVLDHALALLDEQSRALVLLKDLEGYRYDEIAIISGLNESQVKVYLHRARKVLKDYLVSVEHII